MTEIKASEFKAKCLQIMDDVAASGEPVTITKNGVPVAQLCPIRTRPETMFGMHAGAIRIHGDIIEPIDVEWEAMR